MMSQNEEPRKPPCGTIESNGGLPSTSVNKYVENDGASWPWVLPSVVTSLMVLTAS